MSRHEGGKSPCLTLRIKQLNSQILHFFIIKIMIELTCKREVTATYYGGYHKAYVPVFYLAGEVSYYFL